MDSGAGDHLIFDRDEAREWLEIVYGACHSKIHICSTLNWRGNTFSDHEAALDYAQSLHSNGAQGIYVRATTLHSLPSGTPERDRSRGTEGDSVELVGLFADIDIAGPGHRTDKPLPPDEEACRAIINLTGLPTPTVWIHSGGGMYPWWLFNTPARMDNYDDFDTLKALLQNWQKIIAYAARELGYHYGTEVGDLARVLRLPGSVNRKTEDERQCRIVNWTGSGFEVADLIQAADEALRRMPDPLPASVPVQDYPTPTPIRYENDRPVAYANGDTDVRPGDDFNIRADWRSILLNWDWVYQRGGTWYLRRPGKRDGISATIGHSTDGIDRLYVFSSSTEFEPNTPYTKFAAYTLLEHRGDYAAAGRALRAQGFGSERTPVAASSTFSTAAPPAPRSGGTAAGAALASPVESQAVDGTPVPVAGGEYLPSPSAPLEVASVLLRQMPATRGVPHMAYWRDGWWSWTGTHWEPRSAASVEAWIYRQTSTRRYINSKGEPAPWNPNMSSVRNVAHALGIGTLFREDNDDDAQTMAARNGAPLVFCRNGVVDVDTRLLLPHSPSTFNLSSLPYDFDADATCPRWMEFLDQVLPGDTEAQEFLQEWFGYVLSGRTDLQKMANLVGRPRCGKGTVARVLTKLIGQDSVANPSLGNLGTQFGTQVLIGKSLAVLPDVRWNVRQVTEAVPVLLAVVGEDSSSVPRKNRDDWNGQLRTRFMAMGNDTPKFSDVSGALAARMIHIVFPVSFLGRENTALSEQLYEELPGILNWALDGLARLNERGRFLSPGSSVAVAEEVEENSSPIRAFVNEYAEITEDDADVVSLDRLYEEFQQWCADEGRSYTANKAIMARDLRSAFADQGVETVRTRPEPGGRQVRVVRRLKLQAWVLARPVHNRWASGAFYPTTAGSG